jgi:hypothetical protein
MDETLRQAIIQELNLTGVSEDVANDVITRIGGLIMQDVVEQVTDILSDEKVIIFEEVLETYDNDKVSQFLVDEVPNLDELVQASSKKIVGMYKATTA